MMRTTTKPDRGFPQGTIETDRAHVLAGLRVLVVEDVGMVAMALKSLLEELGCVVVATTARLHEAEDLARKEQLDGVLLDLNLGGQYSFPVADILRQRKIPFIIMSGYDAGQLRPDLVTAPQMQKPFEREALEELIFTEFSVRSKGSKGAPLATSRQLPSAAKRIRLPSLKTQGEIESAVCQGMCRFEHEYMGRGPQDVHAHLVGELLVVRLRGVLTAAEQHLAEISPAEHGRDLLKQVRTLLIETARVQIESMIQVITGARVLSMHHDISTITGEEIVIFTLNEKPTCREAK